MIRTTERREYSTFGTMNVTKALNNVGEIAGLEKNDVILCQFLSEYVDEKPLKARHRRSDL